MRFDSLLNPVSESEPCGPDLDEIGDNQYLNYLLGADNRMPTRYLDSETGAPVDLSKIDLKADTKAIGGFLEQSRDLRLLTLDARVQSLSGQIVGFCECVQAIAELLAKYWDDVHPKAYEGDYTLRQNTVSVLDDRTTIVMPLQYAPIIRDPRAGAISLREYAVATGTAAAREGERTIDINQIMETLRSETHRGEVDAVHASLAAARKALASIQSSFDEGTNYQFTPNFDLLVDALRQLLMFIETARPDLGGNGSAAAAEAAPAGEAGAGTVNGTAVLSAPQAAGGRVEAIAIKSHAAAAAALLAAEQYFGRLEPSSPALILVHQARLLVGKPLVSALEALMPDTAETASIIVDTAAGFELNMTKMRAITEDYASGADGMGGDADEPFTAETRAEASALMAGVGAFFRTVEPSSPIPMVLGRAERFMNLSFQAIIADLIPKRNA